METVKDASVAPDGTVTLVGTDPNDPLDVLSVTVTPPPEAGPERWTVPVDGDPPGTEVGDRDSDFRPSEIGTAMENSLVLPLGAVAVVERYPVESGKVAEKIAEPPLSVVTV